MACVIECVNFVIVYGAGLCLALLLCVFTRLLVFLVSMDYVGWFTWFEFYGVIVLGASLMCSFIDMDLFFLISVRLSFEWFL